MVLQTIQRQPSALAVSRERARRADSMAYAPALDGLRAVAILAVLGFHSLARVLKGGFTGVDVFFVLSGYLITSVILYDIRSGKFSMREFYLRRIQRLLPNAIAMVVVTVAISFIFLLPSMAVNVARHGLWAMFNLSNIYILRNFGGYWGDSASSAPLLHTWSLAVEEQFYLAFPLTLWLLSRRKCIFLVTLGFCLASFALNIYEMGSDLAAAFYLLPTRAWEPLVGAMLAIYRVPVTPDRLLRRTIAGPASEIAGWVGLALVAAGFIFITKASSHRGVILLVPAIGTLTLLFSIADGTTGPARLLSKPFFVLIGKLSYSLYLWHWPMIVIGKTYAELLGASQRTGTFIGLFVGIFVAVIAYRVIECPLRQRGRDRGRRLFVLATGFAACSVICVSISLRHPVADSLGLFDRPALYGRLYNVGAAAPQSSIRYADVLFPERVPQSKIWMTGGVVHNWGKGNPRVVVLGSSHALMYGRLIDDICKRENLSVAFLAANGTSAFFPSGIGSSFPTLAQSQDFDAARRNWIGKWNPDAVIVSDRWDEYAGDPTSFAGRLRDLVGELSPHTRTIIVLSQVPVLRLGQTVNLREFVTWHLKMFGRFPTITPDVNEPIRKSSVAILEAVARDFPDVRLVRVDPFFYMQDGSVRFAVGRRFFYADDNHLTDAGTEELRPVLTQALATIK